MKKILILIISAIVIIAAIVTIIIIVKEKTGKLIMVTEAGFAPYEFYDDKGNIVGVDVEIGKAIATEMGKTLVIEDTNFDTLLDKVKSGQADFSAAGLSITEDRLTEVNFSIEYAISKQVIVVKKGSNIISIDDLNGKKVSVQTGTVADSALKEDYPEIKVVERKEYSLAVSDVLIGDSSAIVMDSVPAGSVVNDNPELEILPKELFTDKYGIAVKKGNDKLLNTINTVLQRLMDEGKIQEYTMQYLGE